MASNPDAHGPDNAKKVRRHREKFEQFIADRGGEVLAPTSEWEIVRFKTSSDTAIIYTDKRGVITFRGGAGSAWLAYLHGHPWTAGNRTKRPKGKQGVVVQSLIRRDGRECFYCGRETHDDIASVEHVVPLNAGGTDHMANKVLACRPCNTEAGHLPVIDKVKLRESKRRGRNGT